MISHTMINDIISRLQPEDVPASFMLMATIIDFNGVERTLRGKELEDFLADPDHMNAMEARVILDVRKIRLAIIADINAFFHGLSKRLGKQDDFDADDA